MPLKKRDLRMKLRIACSRSYTNPKVGVWHGPIERTPFVRTRSRTDRVTYLVNAAPIFKSSIWRASAAIAIFSSGATGKPHHPPLPAIFLKIVDLDTFNRCAADTVAVQDFCNPGCSFVLLSEYDCGHAGKIMLLC